MAENKIKIGFEIDGIQNAVSSIDDLNSSLKGTSTTSKNAAKGLDEVTESSKDAAKEQGYFSKKIDEVKESFNGLKAGFGDIKSGYKAMQSGLSGVAKGFGLSGKAADIFGKTTSAAIAATGIGLIIPLVLALVNYFKNLEGGAKVVSKVFNSLGAILGNVGNILKKIISLDFSGAVDEVTGSVKKAVKATDDLYAAEAKLSQLRQKTIVQNAQLRQQIEADKKVLEDTTLSLKDREAALAKVTAGTKQLAQNTITETKTKLDGLKAELATIQNYKEKREKLEEIAEVQAELIDKQTELQGIEYDAIKVGREIRAEAAANAQAARDEAAAAAEERKAQAKEVADTIRDLQINNIKDEEARAQAQLQKQKEDTIASLQENKASKEQILEAEKQFELQKEAITKSFADKKAADQKTKDDEEKAKKLTAQEALAAEYEKDYIDSIENEYRKQEALLAIEQEKQLELARIAGSTEAEIAQINERFANKRKKIAKDETDAKKKLKKEETDAALSSSASILDGIAGLAGEGSAIGKAAAVSSATINTYQAATNALANTPGPPPIPQIAAGVAVAAGLMNIKKILAVKGPGKGSGSAGGGIAVPTVPAAAPIDPNAALTSAAQAQTNINREVTTDSRRGGESVVKAYVVSSEMTNQQQKDGLIKRLSRL